MSKKNFDKTKTNVATDVLGGSGSNVDATKGTESSTAASVADVPTVDASEIKKETTPKNVINTKTAAELVGQGSDSYGGISSGILRAGSAITYSGGAGAIGGDASATIRGERSVKSGDRPGRQMDTSLQHIDDAPAETYVVPITTIPMLNQGTSGVGYNGTYHNEHAISQKGSGGSPADSKFFRTLDEIQYDNLYYADGQYNINHNGAIDSRLQVGNQVGTSSTPTTVTFEQGSFMPQTLNVTINSAGLVTDLHFTTEDLTPTDVSEAVDRVAGDAFTRSSNQSELDRLEMVKVAGDETKPNWSPLGKAIYRSSDTNRFINQYDNCVGDLIALSYAKLNHALAYQCNKAAKDGLRRVAPMYEMCNANVDGSDYRLHSITDDTASIDRNNLFTDKASLKNGSAALYVAIHDTTQKYNTKGKLLSMPLSFKTAVTAASKNIGVFKMHPTFYNEFNRQEVFGKVDADGSGMTPTFISDGAKVILPLDLVETEKTVMAGGQLEAAVLFTSYYQDLRNNYSNAFRPFLTEGLINYFNRHGSKIFNTVAEAKETSVTLTIPITSTTTSISLWDLILCEAVKDISMARRYAMDWVIQYETQNGKWPYTNHLDLAPAMLVSRPNISFTAITEPLGTRPIPLTVASRLIMPEVFIPVAYKRNDAHTTYAVKAIAPWYFSQDAFLTIQSDKGRVWEDNLDNMSVMTFFDYRGGLSFGNADRLQAMDPEQLKLCMDRMVTLPAKHKQVDDLALFTTDVYKYSYHEDGIPTVNYAGYSEDEDDEDSRLTIRDILRTPRELGLSMVAPAGIVTPTAQNGSECGYRQPDSSYFGTSGTSFRLRYWYSADSISNTLFSDNINRTTAVNFKASYCVAHANPYGACTDIGIKFTSNNHDGTFAIAEDIKPFVSVTGDTTYNYDYGTYSNAESQNTSDGLFLRSALKAFYARIQLLPFVVNPFDVNVFDFANLKSQSTWYSINNSDPYDFLHLFNMCGFRAGEYSGLQYDRNRDRIQLGLGYVSDPYIERRL